MSHSLQQSVRKHLKTRAVDYRRSDSQRALKHCFSPPCLRHLLCFLLIGLLLFSRRIVFADALETTCDSTASLLEEADWIEQADGQDETTKLETGPDEHCFSCMCGLTVLFNPLNYSSRKDNYFRFREHTRRQGLWLLAVELSYSDETFLNDTSAEMVVHVNIKSTYDQFDEPDNEERMHDRNSNEDDVQSLTVMWQKERLLNIGLEHLFHLLNQDGTQVPTCENIAWLDADVIFLNENWVEDSCAALEHDFTVLQPFSKAIRLSDKETRDLPQTRRDYLHPAAELQTSSAFDSSKLKTVPRVERIHFAGFAWVARRAVLEDIMLFDKAIIGGADSLMASAFHNPIQDLRQKIENGDFDSLSKNRPLIQSFLSWAEPVHALTEGKVGLLARGENRLLHLWHGDIGNRQYSQRYRILVHGRYDPEEDIELTTEEHGCTNASLGFQEAASLSLSSGVWKWKPDLLREQSERDLALHSTIESQENDARTVNWVPKFSARKLLMHKRIRRFFYNRREDGLH